MREKKIDIIKGIAIVLVVVAHTGIANKFISLFHMAVFFIASGYCFDYHKVLSLRKYCQYFLRKVKTLYCPFVIGSVVFMLMQNTLIEHGFYSSDVQPYDIKNYIKELINILKFGTQNLGNLGGTFWFLRVLFILSILYSFFAYLINRVTKHYYVAQFGISVALLLFGYYCSYTDRKLPVNFDTVCSIYFLFVFGEGFRAILKAISQPYKEFIRKVDILLLGFCTVLLALEYNRYSASIGIGANQYGSPEHLIVSSIVGWIFVWIIAAKLIKIPCLQDMFTALSKKSLWIMMLHFISFKITTKVFQLIGLLDKSDLQKFPIPAVDTGAKVIYIVSGILIPLVIAEFLAKLKILYKSKYIK